LLDYVLGKGFDEALAAVSAFHHRGASNLIGYLERLTGVPEVVDAFHAAIDFLRRQLGDDLTGWQWGRLHQITFMHPIGLVSPLLERFLGLSRGPFPVGGDGDTVAQTGVDPWHPYDAATFTVSYRQVVDLDDWDRMRFILPTGQSGQPGSPHYGDMVEAWRCGEYLPLLFTRAAVEKEVVETIQLRAASDRTSGSGPRRARRKRL